MMYRYGYSSYEIGKWFEVDSNTVLRRLKENNCDVRLPIHLRTSKPKNYVKRNIPDPWTDVDAAYVFGVLIGDASLQYKYHLGEKKNPKGISLDTPDKEFRNTFSRAVESAFGIQVSKHPNRKASSTVITAYSVDLRKSYDRFKWRLGTWRVPKQFFGASEEIKIALYQGKFDSDGGIERKAIVLGSIHRPGLEDMLRITQGLNFKAKIYGPYSNRNPNERDEYRLRIPKCPPELVRMPRKRKELKRAE